MYNLFKLKNSNRKKNITTKISIVIKISSITKYIYYFINVQYKLVDNFPTLQLKIYH